MKSLSLSALVAAVVGLLFAANCGKPPEPTGALKAAVEGKHLGVGLKLGGPSSLKVSADEKAFIAGVEPVEGAPVMLTGRGVKVGLEASARLDKKTSAVQVSEFGTGWGVSLKPVSGPNGFESWGPGVASGSAMFYAAANGESAVIERASATGVKEDIVLTHSLGDEVRFAWDLKVADGLVARLEKDGSVNVYGGRLANVLKYTMPAPVVKAADGSVVPGVARFELGEAKGNTMALTLVAQSMNALSYPVSIDPSLIVSSALQLGTNGNLESQADISSSGNSVVRGKNGFRTNGAWSNASSVTLWERAEAASVTYNGRVYIIGGTSNLGDLSDIEMATLNSSTGDIDAIPGFSTDQITLAATRTGHAAVAYNGYLYVIGGEGPGNTYLNDIQIVHLNATTGVLDGAFATSAQTFTGVRARHSAFAYNGYLYVVGGWNGSAALADTQFAKINADGTLGAFTAGPSLPTARYAHGTAVHNGNLYVTGGTNGISATNYSDVLVSSIGATGVLSSFVSTTSLPTNNFGHTTVAANGYLFVIGGNDGSSLKSDVSVAPINANGTLGSFRAGTAFVGLALEKHTSFVANGFLYALGGFDGFSQVNYVQYAPLTTPGAVGAFAATSSLPAARAGSASVAFNGFLYVAGGINLSGRLGDVQISALNADGTASAFVTSSNTFATARNAPTAAAYNNYLYIIGGDTAGGATATVQRAPINADGTLGVFVADSPMTVARFFASSVVFNGSIYVFGGYNGSTEVASIERGTINPVDGSLTWTTESQALPSARHGVTATTYAGFVYVSGGHDGSSDLSDVLVAQFSPTGSVGSFSTSSLPASVSRASSVAYNGKLFVLGAPPFGTDVYVASIGGNGLLSSFTQNPSSFATGRREQGSVVNNGFLYVIAGINGSYLADVQYARIDSDGALSASTSTTFPFQRWGHGSVANNGFLYIVGGDTSGQPYRTDVQYAALSSTGTVGAFTQSSSALPAARAFHATVAYNGMLYVTGGDNGLGVQQSTVYAAPFLNTGNISPFATASNFSTTRRYHSSVAYHDYLYVVGGQSGGSATGSIEFAPIGADGGVGSFTSTTSIPTGRYGHASVAYNNYLYVIGGTEDVGGEVATVLAAPINTNGTIGNFSAVASLPNSRSYLAAVASDGFLYVTGGEHGSFTNNDVLVSAINDNGKLGGFTKMGTFTTNRKGHGLALANGYLYVTGGQQVLNKLADVQIIQTKTPTVKGTYSRLIDLGSTQEIQSITVNGSARGGNIQLEYRLAAASPTTFGATVTVPGIIPLGSPVTLAGNARYVWLRFTLDDTQAAVINSDSTGQRDILDFTLTTKPPTLSPSSATLPPRGSQTFTCTGGSGSGYTYSLFTNNSNGAVGSTSGAYTAGTTGSVTDTVECSDSLGQTVTADITVTAAITATPATLTIAPRGSQTFSASGGSNTGFTWAFVTNNSMGSLTSGGDYVAGFAVPAGTTDTIRVTDSLGNVKDVTITVTAGITATPATLTIAPRGSQSFSATGGSNTGFTWSFVTNNSMGTLSSGGAYVAGFAVAAGTTDTIRVTDSLSNTMDVTITVTAGITASPASHTTPPRGSQTFTATGGSNAGFTWSFVTNNSMGTLSSAGAYVAGFAVAAGTTDTIRVTDSLNNTKDVTITVTPGITASPASHTTPPRGSQTFTATGGSNTGFTWSFVTNNSMGTIDSMTGAYVAGFAVAAGTTDTIRVTDSLGNTKDVTITVTPGITVSPSSLTLPPSGNATFTPSGGSGTGFTWAFVTNNSMGSVTAGGSYTAGIAVPAGTTDTIRVTDSLGNFKDVVITVTVGITASPASLTTPPRGGQTFTASGGSDSGFTWAFVTNNSMGTLSAAGAYVAGIAVPAGTTDTLRVTDSLGNIKDVTVTVTAGITATPSSLTTPPRGGQTFTATGGSNTGFTWSFVTNNSMGTLSAGGVYVAGIAVPAGTTDTVRVTDSLGNIKDVVVTVTAGITASPASHTSPPRGSQTFTASGGSNTGFSWAFAPSGNNSGGTISSVGAYSAGTTGSVTDTVRVTDSLGNIKDVAITVTPAITASPAAPSIAPRGSQTFTATGGSGTGFSWAFVTNNSMGTLSMAGAYVAGFAVPAGTTDTIRVTDSLGNIKDVTITVTPGITASPASHTSPPRGSQTFTATGGSNAGFTWAFVTNNSGGTLSAGGSYVAGSTGSVTDTIRVTDSLSNTKDVVITVTAEISATPSALTTPPKGSQTFTAAGGSNSGFTWAYVTNNSGGTISAGGAYVAGATGSVTDTVRVTDSLGNTRDVVITVTRIVIATPPAITRNARGGSASFSAVGGSEAGFSWAFAPAGSNSGGSIASNGSYLTGDAGAVIDVLRVSDSLTNTRDVTVTVLPGVSSVPPSITTTPLGLQTFNPNGGCLAQSSSVTLVDDGESAPDGGIGFHGTPGVGTQYQGFANSTNFAAQSNGARPAVTSGVLPGFAAIHQPQFINDGTYGNGASWAAAGASNVWVKIDLGRQVAIDRVQFGRDRLGAFDDRQPGVVRVSVANSDPNYVEGNDSAPYVQVYDSVNNIVPALGQTVVMTFAPVTARFIKVSFPAPLAPSLGSVGIDEIEVFGCDPMLQTCSSLPINGCSTTWSFLTNASMGTLVQTGNSVAYTAGRTGTVTDVLRVVDTLGNRADVPITVTPGVSIIPGNASVTPRGTATFTASGGTDAGFVWVVRTNNSGGSISQSGVYVAGDAGLVSDLIRVTDSIGNFNEVVAFVSASVTSSPPSANVPPNAPQLFTASGGTNMGLTWSIVTNNSGATFSSMGANASYVAGSTGGVTDTLHVEDSLGNSTDVVITVQQAVVAVPSSVTIPPRGTRGFAASGGSGTGFTWTYSGVMGNLSGGTLSSTGVYVAGTTPNVTDTLLVTDSLGGTATATVTVGPGVSVSPQATTATPRQLRNFTATGGSGTGFVWAFAPMGNNSNGTIASDGTYVAGRNGGVIDVLTATDSLGNVGTASINVSAGITPSGPATVAPREAQTLSATGGSGTGFTWTFAMGGNVSGGTVSSGGAYVAGTVSGTDVLLVTDSLGNTANLSIAVTQGLSVATLPASLPPRGSQTFTASGGSGVGFVYSFASNLSGGTIGSSTGDYVAGAVGNVVDVLRVTDSLNNSVTFNVSVTAGVTPSSPTASVAPRGTQTFSAMDGSGTGFTWGFAPGGNLSGGSITPPTSSGIYVAGATGSVTDTLRVTDSLGNFADVAVTVTPGISITPSVATVAPRGTRALSPSGGSNAGFLWTMVASPSGGSVSAGGLYSAGTVGGVTDIVQVEDSLHNTATISITVTATLAASPSAPTVVPRATQTFTATGGSGSGFTWAAVGMLASGGSITAGGVYTAGSIATAMTPDVVRVTDSNGNTATASITVSAGVSITPSSPSTPPNSTITFTAAGGSAVGYSWSLVASGSGSPTINPVSGAYRAGTAQGTDRVQVTDSLGNTATVDVTVTNALAVTPGSISLAPRATQTFSATGGSGTGFTWAFVTNNSNGTLGASTGTYVAGATPNVTDTIRVTDSLSNTTTVTITVGAGVTSAPLTVAPRSARTLAATGGSGTGFTWAFVTNGSGGTVSPSGAYVAGSTGNVTDTLRVTDSLSNSGTVTITVSAGVSASPTNVNVSPRGTQTFTATGGSGTGFTWSLPTNNSGGTIVASTGAYTAGNAGGVTDTVRVTDSLGNTADVSVVVGAGITVMPTTVSVAPRGSQTFVASGGSGMGYTWAFFTNASSGTVSSTGVYAAGATGSVTDVLRVTDSAGNTLDVSVNVTAGVQPAPATATVAPRGTQAFTATGGSGSGFRWTLATNNSGGTVSVGGAYVAGTTGNVTDTLRVTDSFGNTATVTVTVGAGLRMTPLTATLPPRGSQTFVATGGTDAGFVWSVPANASGATVDGGAYVAGITGGVNDVVQVVDSAGNTATASVTVTAGVSTTPATATVPPRGTQTFVATGGSATGFVWSFVTNASDAGITAAGVYTAGTIPSVGDVLKVTDSLGNFETVPVTVGRGVTPQPPAPSTAPSGTVAFTASGGSGTGYTWAMVTAGSTGASISSTGAYRAGSTAGTDVVRVTDSLGNSANVSITVTTGLAVTPGTVSLSPRGTQTFTATGGSGSGFVWTFATNNSGGTLSAFGAYVAGSTPSVMDVIRVTDSLGNTATATVSIGAGLSVTPATRTVAPRGALTFTASGGAGSFGWTFATNASGGTVSVAGAYVAGSTPNVTDVLRVADSAGNTLTISIAVGAGVAIAPSVVSLAPRASQALSATGGSGSGYVWAFVTNNSMGTLNMGTGAYVAGSVGGVTDTVRVTDSLGNTTTQTITVTAGVRITPSMVTLLPGATQQLTATGGSGAGFSWSLATNLSGGNVSASGLYTAGATADVVDVVQVTDALGNTATLNVSVGAPLVISPLMQAALPGGTITFTAMGGAAPYRWALTTNASNGTLSMSGAYVAGMGAGIDTVQVTDSRGATASTTVTVSAALSVNPTSAMVVPRGTTSFSGMGGTGTYTYALTTNNSGGTLSATGAYVAGSKGGVTDVVTVSDGRSMVTANVVVGPSITITPPQKSVVTSENVAFTAAGGSGMGYVWTLSVNNSGATISASGNYVSGTTGDVADEVTVTDSLGNTATAAIAVAKAGNTGCGCSSGAPGFVLFGLLALFGKRRRSSKK